ncbi:MAG: hypothetical protein JWQ30_414 [Sediminibacterium sp.]|nr:hypothetical protein [Sediminibacterium sp.]
MIFKNSPTKAGLLLSPIVSSHRNYFEMPFAFDQFLLIDSLYTAVVARQFVSVDESGFCVD